MIGCHKFPFKSRTYELNSVMTDRVQINYLFYSCIISGGVFSLSNKQMFSIMKEYDELAVLEEIQQELMSHGKTLCSCRCMWYCCFELILKVCTCFLLQKCLLLRSMKGTCSLSSSTYRQSWRAWTKCTSSVPSVTREWKKGLLWRTCWQKLIHFFERLKYKPVCCYHNN